MQLVVGRIGRAHGVRGDLFLEVRTDDPELRFAPGNVLQTDDGQSLTIASSKWHSGRLVIHFSGFDDRTSAELLRGRELSVDVDPDVLPADPDEFYDYQLVGLTVVVEEPQSAITKIVGEVSDVLHLPHQDHLAVRRKNGTEVLIPFVKQFVPKIDITNRTIIITPPPGLLDEQNAVVVQSEEGSSDADL